MTNPPTESLREQLLQAIFDLDDDEHPEPFPPEEMEGMAGVYGMQTIEESTIDRLLVAITTAVEAARPAPKEARDFLNVAYIEASKNARLTATGRAEGYYEALDDYATALRRVLGGA